MEVNRVRLLIIAVVLVPLVVIAANVLLNDSTPIASSPGGYSGFTVGGRTFHFTYVATNQTMREKGLMGAKVTDSTTELFVFPSSDYYSFWMYGVNSSLDIMWVDVPVGGSSGSVVYLALDSPPCHVTVVCTNYQPTAKADFVIEAKGGFAAMHGIKLGTTVTIN
jgi:uncharacterized membrane protein (UPF0127 family)